MYTMVKAVYTMVKTKCTTINQPTERFNGGFTYTLLFCILGLSFRGGGGRSDSKFHNLF